MANSSYNATMLEKNGRELEDEPVVVIYCFYPHYTDTIQHNICQLLFYFTSVNRQI